MPATQSKNFDGAKTKVDAYSPCYPMALVIFRKPPEDGILRWLAAATSYSNLVMVPGAFTTLTASDGNRHQSERSDSPAQKANFNPKRICLGLNAVVKLNGSPFLKSRSRRPLSRTVSKR